VPIFTLAKFTIRGYLKERILLVVLLFAFMLMVASYVLSPLAVGAQQKVVVDIGLAALSIFAILLIVLLGAGSFHKEKEQGILKALLVKPITRADWIIGKYAGTVLTVAMVVVLMAALVMLVMLISGAPIGENFFWAVYLAILEAMVVTAVLTLFSSYSSPVLASFFTICAVVAGHFSRDLFDFAERFSGPALKVVATGAFYVIPNLGLFNIRSEAVYGLSLPDGFIYTVSIYALFYTATTLMLAVLLFRNKELN